MSAKLENNFEMKNLLMCLDEISPGNLKTLQHAAEISPLVTCRTIGPDIEPLEQETTKEVAEPNEREQSKTPENSKNIKENSSSGNKNAQLKLLTPPTPPSPPALPGIGVSMSCLDYQTIQTSVLLREAEQKRRLSIRKKVIEMHEKSHEQAAQRRLNAATGEQNLRNDEARKKWWASRLTDAEIEKQAEEIVAKEVAESKREIEAMRLQTKRKLQAMAFEAISKCQVKFRRKYELVATLIVSIDKDALLACGGYNGRLKEIIVQFEQLITKIKTGDCDAAELYAAQGLNESLDALEQDIIKDIENLMQRTQQLAEEAKLQKLQEEKAQQLRKEEEEQKQQLLQKQEAETAAVTEAQTPATTTSMTATTTVTDAPQTAAPAMDAGSVSNPSDVITTQLVSDERFKFYTLINSFYQEKVDKVKPLQTNDAFKKYRFACQKAINIPVNAISAVTPQHLQDKFEKLYNFISGQPTKTADGQISIQDHPLGRDFCILLMAKKFVNQGDTAISSNPQAAFPVASVVVSLWKLVPDFGQLFLAYIFKESPLLVPYIMPQQPGQSIEEYSKVLGYRLSDGKPESQDMFLKRQAGIARLYAAVMITAGRRIDGPMHPFNIDNGWRWLSNFTNLPPLPDISATLLLEILQIIGNDMCMIYGRQFVKLLFYIQQHYFPKLVTLDEGGPKTRLELLLRKFLQEGLIARPVGTVPVGFW